MSKERQKELLEMGFKEGDIVYVYYIKDDELREERCKVVYESGWYFLENLDYIRNRTFLYGSAAGQPSKYRLIYKEKNKKKAVEELIELYTKLMNTQLSAAYKTAQRIEKLKEEL